MFSGHLLWTEDIEEEVEVEEEILAVPTITIAFGVEVIVVTLMMKWFITRRK